MKVDTTFYCQVVMMSYTKAYQQNDVKATCAAKSSLRLDFNKTRNPSNTLRVQNYLANGLKFYFSYILKAVLTAYAPKVFGSRQPLRPFFFFLQYLFKLCLSNRIACVVTFFF